MKVICDPTQWNLCVLLEVRTCGCVVLRIWSARATEWSTHSQAVVLLDKGMWWASKGLWLAALVSSVCQTYWRGVLMLDSLRNKETWPFKLSIYIFNHRIHKTWYKYVALSLVRHCPWHSQLYDSKMLSSASTSAPFHTANTHQTLCEHKELQWVSDGF